MKRKKTKLNSFRDLECPKCKLALEDGDDVIEIECSYGHVYHSNCLYEYLKELEEEGLFDTFKCLECKQEV